MSIGAQRIPESNPSLPMADYVGLLESAGLTREQIKENLQKKKNLGVRREDNVSLSIGEATLQKINEGVPREEILRWGHSHGINNLLNLTPEQQQMAMPGVMAEVGEYNSEEHADWKWMPNRKTANAPSSSANVIDKWIEWKDAHYQRMTQPHAGDPFAPLPPEMGLEVEPDLTPEEKDYASKVWRARGKLAAAQGVGGRAGAGASAFSFAAEMFHDPGQLLYSTGILKGPRPFAPGAGVTQGVIKAANTFGSLFSVGKLEAPAAMRRAIDADPDLVELADNVTKQHHKDVQEVRDYFQSLTGRSAKPEDGMIPDGKYKDLVTKHLGYDVEGEVSFKDAVAELRTREKLSGAQTKATKALDRIEDYPRKMGNIMTRPEFDSVSEWVMSGMDVYGKDVEKLSIAHDEYMNLSRRVMNKMQKRKRERASLFLNVKDEAVEIAHGVYELAQLFIGKTKGIDGLARQVVRGEVDIEEAKFGAMLQSYKEGKPLMGGLASYMSPFTTSIDETWKQQQTLPIDTALWLLGPGYLMAGALKGAARIRLTSKLKTMEKGLIDAGATPAEIAFAKSVKIADQEQKVAMRRFFETALGKHTQSNLGRTILAPGVPEGFQGALGGALIGAGFGGAFDTYMLGGTGGALGAAGGMIRHSPKAMRYLDDLSRGSTDQTSLINKEIIDAVEELAGAESRLATASEDWIQKRRQIAEEELVSVPEASDYVARLRSAVDNDPLVLLAERRLNEAVSTAAEPGQAGAAAYTARIEELKALVDRARNQVRIELAETSLHRAAANNDTPFVLPEETFAEETASLFQARQKTKDMLGAEISEQTARLEGRASGELEAIRWERIGDVEAADDAVRGFNAQAADDLVALGEKRAARLAEQAEDQRGQRAAALEEREAARERLYPQRKSTELEAEIEGLEAGRSKVEADLEATMNKSIEAADLRSKGQLRDPATGRLKKARVKISKRERGSRRRLAREKKAAALAKYDARIKDKKARLKKLNYNRSQVGVLPGGTKRKGERAYQRISYNDFRRRQRAAKDELHRAQQLEEVEGLVGILREASSVRRNLRESRKARDQALDDSVKMNLTPEESNRMAFVDETTAYIDELRAIDKQSQRDTMRVYDNLLKMRAEQYDRAFKYAYGIHIDDGNYVQNLKRQVYWDEAGQEFKTFKPDEDSGGVAPSRSIELPQRGRGGEEIYGTVDPDGGTYGNLLTVMSRFPAQDIPPLFRLVTDYADRLLDTIDGLAKPVDKTKKALAKAAERVESRAGAAQRKAKQKLEESGTPQQNLKFSYEGQWVDDVLKDISPEISNPGRNDIRRAVLEVFGDVLLNQHSHAILLNPKLQKRFVSYAAKRMQDELNLRPHSAGFKDKLKELKKEAANMAVDVANGRTFDGGIFGRVDYEIVDSAGNARQYKSANRGTQDLTMLNLFRDFMDTTASNTMINRAKRDSFTQVLTLFNRAAEGRVVVDTLFKQLGISRQLWDDPFMPASLVAKPEYVESVYRHFINSGQLPPVFKTKSVRRDRPHSLSPEHPENRVLLQRLIEEHQAKGGAPISLDELSLKMKKEFDFTSLHADKKKRQGYYVRADTESDYSNIPGVQRIGQGDWIHEGQGIQLPHSPVQPEHTATSLKNYRDAAGRGELFIRTEIADTIGYQLGTHSYLQALHEIPVLSNVIGTNALWKWGKTAGSMVNPMTNFLSNITTKMISGAINPVRTWVEVGQSAVVWRRYREGQLKGTALERRIDAILNEGLEAQSVLIAEVDSTLRGMQANGVNSAFTQSLDDIFRGGRIPFTDTELKIPLPRGANTDISVRAWSEFLDKSYRRFGDELFKFDEAIREIPVAQHLTDAMPEGEFMLFMDLDTGAGIANPKPLGGILKEGDGYTLVFNYGKRKGKTVKVGDLDDPIALELLAKAAMGKANSKYYNLQKTGIAQRFIRNFEAVSLGAFTSWRSKAADIPMVKRGMTFRMFADDMYMVSTSPKTTMDIYSGQAGKQISRATYVSALKEKYGDMSAERKVLPRWARNAVLPGGLVHYNEWYLAESSMPMGGMLQLIEVAADASEYWRGKVAIGNELYFDPAQNRIRKRKKGERIRIKDRLLWDKFEGDPGFMPTAQEATLNLLSGGIVDNLIMPMTGTNPLTGGAFKTAREQAYAIAKTVPGWWTWFMEVPERLLKESRAQYEFNPEDIIKNKQQTPLLLTGGGIDSALTGDDVYSVVNSLIARKWRKANPIWLANTMAGVGISIAGDLEKWSMIKMSGAKLPREQREELARKLDLINAYKRNMPRLIEALNENGIARNAILSGAPNINKMKNFDTSKFEKKMIELFGGTEVLKQYDATQQSLEGSVQAVDRGLDLLMNAPIMTGGGE